MNVTFKRDFDLELGWVIRCSCCSKLLASSFNKSSLPGYGTCRCDGSDDFDSATLRRLEREGYIFIPD